ncbi:MAG: pyridoxal phosphate-dependent aminotransferase [Candidatus Bathyarchaeota archaeon]|nr:pyridoxal phosphate-dependent aminotransferase [Candidatus Bathyarchaeota archaeon]
MYLNWYIHVPQVKYDFRSSGISYFKYNLTLGEVDLNANYSKLLSELLAQRYNVKPENVFISSEGASGQNARIIRYLAEKDGKKREAIVEYPTYEPLLRQVQEHFPCVKRLERRKSEAYRLDVEELQKKVSEKTRLLVLTNPHAPSGTIANANELKEIMAAASEYGFYVLCDEIYAEFDRSVVPTLFSIDKNLGIVTTSFTKAYGLGGLRLGIALAKEDLVEELYNDVVNTIGGSVSIVQLIAAELLKKDMDKLEKHKQKWTSIKSETEKWLSERGFRYFPNKTGVTYWIELPIKDTYRWINEHAIPKHGLTPVPGAFFLFKSNYKLVKSNMVRLGLGNVNPDNPNLAEAFEAFEKALETYRS